ncbi:R3H domain-containing protein 4 [Scleropages formosus]|uniref:R3H domain containing 4 n=1 Tax=Scleropages formosus TaxID=113540 RepID=A0A8C9WHL2_SCLFO|nr:R3H domain-containing protein 4 [Scleropages formosus]
MVVLSGAASCTATSSNNNQNNNRNEGREYVLIEEHSSVPSSPSKRVSPSKRKQFFINQAIRNSDLIPRAKGKKSLQRQENTRYLANLLERDECSKDEGDVCGDPASPSIFTEACTNSNYVQSWNDFMNRSGEEQEKMLAVLEEKARRSCTDKQPKDQRAVNPAYSAQDYFLRIDRRLRTTLRRKQIPLGILEVLEEDLLRFFVAQPHSVYITRLGSSFERLLLHAICQYMDLVSASTDCNGARQTEVVNKQEEFLPPKPLLSVYLEQMS